MSKKMIVKVQTPLNKGAEPLALIYDQTKEIMSYAAEEDMPQWDEVVKAGGKAYYLAKISDGRVSLIRRVKDRAW